MLRRLYPLIESKNISLYATKIETIRVSFPYFLSAPQTFPKKWLNLLFLHGIHRGYGCIESVSTKGLRLIMIVLQTDEMKAVFHRRRETVETINIFLAFLVAQIVFQHKRGRVIRWNLANESSPIDAIVALPMKASFALPGRD